MPGEGLFPFGDSDRDERVKRLPVENLAVTEGRQLTPIADIAQPHKENPAESVMAHLRFLQVRSAADAAKLDNRRLAQYPGLIAQPDPNQGNKPDISKVHLANRPPRTVDERRETLKFFKKALENETVTDRRREPRSC